MLTGACECRPAGAIAVLTAAFLSSAAIAGTSNLTYVLSNHPDAQEDPPPYGLRSDNMFTSAGGSGGVTTFSFDTIQGVTLTVAETMTSRTITIQGVIEGGERDSGFGVGFFDLNFTYKENVNESGTGWFVSPTSLENKGSITALAGNTDIAQGTVFDFFEDPTAENPFAFFQDDHRLLQSTGGKQDFPEAGMGYFVGRGWTALQADGRNSEGTQDWLFIGQLIPLPNAAGLTMLGLSAVAIRRRRAIQ